MHCYLLGQIFNHHLDAVIKEDLWDVQLRITHP